jgi:hypothetical protein
MVICIEVSVEAYISVYMDFNCLIIHINIVCVSVFTKSGGNQEP